MLLKYCGFSMTGILVMPMITASGPISEDDGVLLPLETWWRGEAESSSLLITEDGPKRTERWGQAVLSSNRLSQIYSDGGTTFNVAVVIKAIK